MSIRTLFFLILMAVLGLLGFGFYLEVFQGFQPCPLCNLQRLCFMLIAACAFFGVLLHRHRWTTRVLSLFTTLFALLGGGFALRQTWIQVFPSADLTECGVSVQYMLQVLPWHEVAKKILSGSAECSQRTWEFLSLSMAEWSLLCFAALIVACGVLIRKSARPSRSTK